MRVVSRIPSKVVKMRCKRATGGKYAAVEIRLTHVNLLRLIIQTDERGNRRLWSRESRSRRTDNASDDRAIAGQHLAMAFHRLCKSPKEVLT